MGGTWYTVLPRVFEGVTIPFFLKLHAHEIVRTITVWMDLLNCPLQCIAVLCLIQQPDISISTHDLKMESRLGHCIYNSRLADPKWFLSMLYLMPRSNSPDEQEEGVPNIVSCLCTHLDELSIIDLRIPH